MKYNKHHRIPIDEKMIYVGGRDDWYGSTVLVKRFSIYWCRPAYGDKKPHFKCDATISVDIFETTCPLSELVPICNN